MEDKVISPEKAEEAKLKARYPNLGAKPGGSDLLRKRLQKGVRFRPTPGQLPTFIISSILSMFSHCMSFFLCAAKVLWFWWLQHGKGKDEEQTVAHSSNGESWDHRRPHPNTSGPAPEKAFNCGQQVGWLIGTALCLLFCYHSNILAHLPAGSFFVHLSLLFFIQILLK